MKIKLCGGQEIEIQAKKVSDAVANKLQRELRQILENGNAVQHLSQCHADRQYNQMEIIDRHHITVATCVKPK